jgi:hypothetical protein
LLSGALYVGTHVQADAAQQKALPAHCCWLRQLQDVRQTPAEGCGGNSHTIKVMATHDATRLQEPACQVPALLAGQPGLQDNLVCRTTWFAGQPGLQDSLVCRLTAFPALQYHINTVG